MGGGGPVEHFHMGKMKKKKKKKCVFFHFIINMSAFGVNEFIFWH